MAKHPYRLFHLRNDPSPCYECPPEAKYRACHDTCEKFAEWKAKGEEIKRAQRDYQRIYGKYPPIDY